MQHICNNNRSFFAFPLTGNNRCVLNGKQLSSDLIRQSLIGQHQIGQTAERNHLNCVRSGITDFIQFGDQIFEINNAVEDVIAESMQSAAAVVLRKVLEVNGLDAVAEDFDRSRCDQSCLG